MEGTCQPLRPGAYSGVRREAADTWTPSRMWTVTQERSGAWFSDCSQLSYLYLRGRVEICVANRRSENESFLKKI